MKKTLYIQFALFFVCWLLQISNVHATCNNVTSGGQIGTNQSGCAPFDPAVIQNTQSASGGSNTLIYEWRYKNSSTGNNYQVISGATSSTYNPGVITETTYYKRFAKRQYCTSYLESNSVCMTVTTCCNAAINSVVVYNLNNNSNFLTLANGGVYSLSNFPGNWNLEALVSGTTAESVVFTISGSASSSNTENAVPFRSPGDAIALNLGAGSYTVNVKLYSHDNAGGQKCDEETISFTLTPPCILNVNAGADVLLCTPTKTLTATSSGVSTCSTQVITDCNHPLANSGGWLLDVPASSVCGDNAGTKLWTQSGQGTSYITLDMGTTLPAGTPICVNMKLEHCSNTSSGYSNAKIQASTSASSGFVNLTSSVTFSHTSFQEYCYNLPSSARYIKILDNGNCALRVDYVKYTLPGTINSTVSYSWSGPGIVGAANTASVNVNQTGSYIVTVTDCNGCIDKDTVLVSSCCNLNVDAGADVSSCTASAKTFTATSTGAGVCSTQVITDCNHPLANSGGWLLDVPASSVCGDNAGTKLWTQSGQGTSYITLDMGTTLPAGTPICVNMKLEHCSNTSTGYSNAKIQASASAGSGFVNLTSSVTFSHTNFQEYCYNLASSARYIKILDNGNCAFRVDYVKYTIPGTNNSNVTYSWSTGATTSSITVNQPGTYIVTATDCKGCVDTDTVKYIVNQPPNCQITGNSSCCLGSSVQLCAPAGLGSYLWSTGSTSQCISVNATGTYTVTVTDANGCTSSCYKTVTVNPPSTCIITGNNIICQGGSTQLCAPAGLASYLWSTGATTQCINVTTQGNYSVTVTNANGCTSTCDKYVTVNQLPACQITGNNSCCAGSSVQLCAPAGLASYLWSTGATSRCINVNTTGTYAVTVTDANGCTSSCNKSVTVNPPPVCQISGANSICQGTSAVLCANTGFASYLWSTGETTQCITVTTQGSYSVTVTDANGCESTCNKYLTVTSPPVCSISGNNSCCSGGSAELCAPVGLASYLWSTGETTRCIEVSVTGNYTVSVTDANGCVSICDKNVTVNPPPGCLITGNNSFCYGSSTQLCAPAGHASYLWSTGETSQCINVNAEGTFSVTVTDANGCTSTCDKYVTVNQLPGCSINGSTTCCYGDPVQLCVPATLGASSYLWSTGETTRCISVTTTGTYSVTVTGANGCTSTCDKTVTFYNPPYIHMPVFDNVCDTLSNGIVLTGATPVGGTYSGTGVINGVFYPSIAGLGTHTITYTYSNGHCEASKTAEITVIHCVCILPVNPEITGITAVCIPAQLGYTATGAVGATNYFWSVTPGATIVSGQGTPNVIISYSALCLPGHICVVASNSCGNSDTICTPFYTITKVPVIIGGIAGQSNGVCPGAVSQYCVVPVSQVDNYVWTVPANTNIISGHGTNCITIEFLAGFASGNITVNAQNCKGLSGAKSLTVRSLPLLPGVIAGEVSNLCQATGVVYSIASVLGADSYLWTVPPAANIVSGQGTSSITVDFGAGFNTGSITVKAVNACGTSGTRNLAVKAKAATPATIYGLNSVCANVPGIPYIVDPQPGVAYTWSVPAGALIASGQGTDNIIINWGVNQGNVSVVAANACGNSPAKTLAVTVINCNRTFAPEIEAVSPELSVYPNPVQSDLTIKFDTEAESAYTITVTDIIGKVIYNSNLFTTTGSNIRTINVDDFAKGLYIVTMKGEGFNKSIKITVE